MPFDHPACAEPGAAPEGIVDETVLLNNDQWQRLSSCTSTAQLAEWVTELRAAVEKGVAAARVGAAKRREKRGAAAQSGAAGEDSAAHEA